MKTPIDVELMKRIFNSKPSKINGEQLQFQQCERRKQSLNQNDTNRKVIFTQTFFACLYFKRICGSGTMSISILLISLFLVCWYLLNGTIGRSWLIRSKYHWNFLKIDLKLQIVFMEVIIFNCVYFVPREAEIWLRTLSFSGLIYDICT